ncbi:MAG TPA: hypothetical protein VG457_00430 [Planctomycetota bacterium]|nr:hypothetical protein [Planctomycetota bacterium]
MSESRTCDFCSMKLSPSDFDEGRAMVLLKRIYCRTCMERAVRQKTKNPKDTRKHTRDKPR